MTRYIAASFDDHAALRLAARTGAPLATIVGIDGAYSRRLGAQLCASGEEVAGSLADGCLEKEISARMADPAGKGANLLRYGAGSPFIDFHLPCGAGLDVLLDPSPDAQALQEVARRLDAREGASLALPLAHDDLLAERHYIPALRILVFGDGPEVEALMALGASFGAVVEHISAAERLSLGQHPKGIAVDRWTALGFLFHDHEWEASLLDWALNGEAFYIGAQGGAKTREARREALVKSGWSDAQIGRVRSPVGLIDHARDPQTLALSLLAEIVRDYEQMHPHSCAV